MMFYAPSRRDGVWMERKALSRTTYQSSNIATRVGNMDLSYRACRLERGKKKKKKGPKKNRMLVPNFLDTDNFLG